MASSATTGAPTVPEPAMPSWALKVRLRAPRWWASWSGGAFSPSDMASITKPSTSAPVSPASSSARRVASSASAATGRGSFQL